MASGRSTITNARGTRVVEYEQFIDAQIQKTRSHVKLIDLCMHLLVLGGGMLLLLLAAAIAEHWILPGGMGRTTRVLAFVALCGWTIWYFARQVWPLISQRINPAYAAAAIEQTNPSLKNSLLNLLFLRDQQARVPTRVFKAVQQQAATRLASADVDPAVDRSHLIRIGYAVVALVVIAAVYKVASPKDPLPSAARVLAPWADISPPTRVAIQDIQPGSIQIARGSTLEVSAEVIGSRFDEPIVLRYSTADERATGQRVEMMARPGTLRFVTELPPKESQASTGPAGVQQGLTYWIEAGDARSSNFEIKIIDSPTIVVQEVTYDFPDYTGLVDRTQYHVGDIQAIEGTRVVIRALTNEKIRAGHIDFDFDGRKDRPLVVDGHNAEIEFALEMAADRLSPRYHSYGLRFAGESGRHNLQPVRYRIDVTPDYVPEVSLTRPEDNLVQVAVDDALELGIDARDPDFALSHVAIQGTAIGSDGEQDCDLPLLKQPHAGRFSTNYRFVPAEHGFAAGDVVEVWAVAIDNKQPDPNVAVSARKRIEVLPSNQPPPDPDQPHEANREAAADQRSDEVNQQQQPKAENGQDSPERAEGDSEQQSQQGESGEGQQGEGQQGEGQQGEGQQGEGQQGEGQQGEGQQGEGQQGEGQQGEGQQGEGQQGESQQGEGQNDAGEQGEGQPRQGQRRQGQAGEEGAEQATGEGETGEGPADESGSSKGQRGSDRGQGRDSRAAANDGSQDRAGRDPAGQDGESAKPAEIPADGSADAEAFERIAERLEREEPGGSEQDRPQAADDGQSESGPQANEQQSDASGSSEQGSGESGVNDSQQPDRGDPSQGDGEASGEEVAGQPAQQDSPDKPASQGQSSSGERREGEPRDGEAARDAASEAKPKEPSPTGEAAGASQEDQQGDGSTSEKGETGADQQPDATQGDTADEESQQQGSGEQTKPPGGQNRTEGPAGGGDQDGQQGTPDSELDPKPSPKRQQDGSGEQPEKDGSDAPAGGKGTKESDSHGEQGGDRPGGGDEGDGQKTPRDGTGGSGQHTSADEGAGRSSEKGTGETSDKPGGSQTSDRPTGESGDDQAGQGTEQRTGQGDQPGGQPGERGSDDPSQRPPRSADQDSDAESGSDQSQQGEPTPDSSEGPGAGGNEPGGGGRPAPARNAPPKGPRDGNYQGDEANLEYARKQTEMVLDYLENQLEKGRVDEELLDEMGWNQDDLRRFVERWKKLKESPRQATDPQLAKRELDDALRALGLKKSRVVRQGNDRFDDDNRDLRDAARTPIPPEFRRRAEQYVRGVSKSQ